MDSQAGHGVQAMADFGKLLNEILEKALLVKTTNAVEPPLNRSDLSELFERVNSVFPPFISSESKKHAIETAARDTFNNLLATTTIDSPSFVQIWNLLDIISVLEEDEQAEPALLFWLVEELLDSQTISGCRKIFDYLESRRERITTKNFLSKHLVILRSCNELLRRLSRAEDTAFCGRVFIFLFQSFPLGDKSSVNLRGEYHAENVTTFDTIPSQEASPETMEVDAQANQTSKQPEEAGNSVKGVSFSQDETPITPDQLYPIFWSLQQSFSQPKKLFEKANFSAFRSGLEATMIMFKSIQAEGLGRTTKVVDESKRGTKRKRGQSDDDLANAFNPKYLTSRDLFELEISDLSFRRHILVQILIVMDFMLSLSVKSKEKLAKATIEKGNLSVMYADQVLSEDDTKWCQDMKKSIADYLKQGFEGAFFYRMVETVLSRDKNWARWKVENCPSIAKPAILGREYSEAKVAARKATTNKRLRPNPIGSLDLKFLSESEGPRGLDRLKDSSRYEIPAITVFKNKINDDDFDIEMARDEESRSQAVESKASKSWRALRIASTTKLVAFDKIERSDKIDEIFQENTKPEESGNSGEDVDDTEYPKDRRPIVISGPSGVGKGTLVNMLIEEHGKVLGRKASHTTRPARENELDGQHYYFITQEVYSAMRDGDEFLELNNFNGNDYGTAKKVVEGIIAQGKIPLMEMDMHGIQQLKDQGYAARFIFLAPPDIGELEQRLKRRGSNDPDTIKARLEIAKQELEKSKIEGFHDLVLVNDDLKTTYKKLSNYIFGGEDSTDGSSPLTPMHDVRASPAIAIAEVGMGDGEGLEAEQGLNEGQPALEKRTTTDDNDATETSSQERNT